MKSHTQPLNPKGCSKELTGFGEPHSIHKSSMASSMGTDVKIIAGYSKRLSRKAAASEDRRRTLWGALRI
jgi:hypothetical protein